MAHCFCLAPGFLKRLKPRTIVHESSLKPKSADLAMSALQDPVPGILTAAKLPGGGARRGSPGAWPGGAALPASVLLSGCRGASSLFSLLSLLQKAWAVTWAMKTPLPLSWCLLFPVPLESEEGSTWAYNLKHFPMVSSSGFRVPVLNLSLGYILIWFLCRLKDRDILSVFCPVFLSLSHLPFLFFSFSLYAWYWGLISGPLHWAMSPALFNFKKAWHKNLAQSLNCLGGSQSCDQASDSRIT